MTTLKDWSAYFIKLVVDILNFNLKVWWLIILLVVLILLRFIYLKLIKETISNTPRFLDYTADSFNFFIWKWNWVYNTLIKKWEIESLYPICNNRACQGELEYKESSYNAVPPKYICKKCNTTYKALESQDAVARKITDNANRGNFSL